MIFLFLMSNWNCLILLHFHNGRHFEVVTIFFTGSDTGIWICFWHFELLMSLFEFSTSNIDRAVAVQSFDLFWNLTMSSTWFWSIKKQQQKQKKPQKHHISIRQVYHYIFPTQYQICMHGKHIGDEESYLGLEKGGRGGTEVGMMWGRV